MTTMRKSLTAFAGALLLIAAGCKGNGGSATSGSTSVDANQPSTSIAPATTPEQLGALGAQIKKQPNDAHRLLIEHGLNEQSFAAAIRKVSEDPAAAKRYAAAYRQSSS